MSKDIRPHQITLAPQGWQFDCAPTQTILQAALAAGLRLPHSCRNGTCRACVATLLDGQIDYLIEWPGLSREEKAEGMILPCVARPRCDLTIQAQASPVLSDASSQSAPDPAAK